MHLFAGAGGGLLADLILGHTPIIAVEWEPYACQVLRERAADGWFPELYVWEGDVRLFDPSEYAGSVDCIHAGFPCQDISVAGKQAGVGTETRSGLYREVLRIAGVVRPRYLFLENASAIVTNGLGTVLADLTALGYDSEWLCLRASDCGANHQRDRWWLLADSGKHRRGIGPDEYIAGGELQTSPNTGFDGPQEPMADATRQLPHRRRRTWNGRAEPANGGEDVAYTNSTQCQGNERAFGIGTEYTNISGAGWWAVEPDVGRVADGVSARVHRLKALGNAQVPLQAAVAWRLLGCE